MKKLLSLVLFCSSLATADNFAGPYSPTIFKVGSTATFSWTADPAPPPANFSVYVVCLNLSAYDVTGTSCTAAGSQRYVATDNAFPASISFVVPDPGNDKSMFVTLIQPKLDPVNGWGYVSFNLPYPTTPAIVGVDWSTFIGPAAGTTLPVGSTQTFSWTPNTTPAPGPPSPRYILCVSTVAFDTSGLCGNPGSQSWLSGLDTWVAVQIPDPGDNNSLYVVFKQRVFDPTLGWYYNNTQLLYPTTPASMGAMKDVGGTGNPIATPGNDAYSDPMDPRPVLVSPNSGSGQTQAFTFLATDEGGWADIAWLQIMIGNSGTCVVYWNPNGVYQLNGTPTALGSNQIFHQTDCDILNSQSSVSVSGNDVSLTLQYSFVPTWAGTQNIYMNVASSTGLPSPGTLFMGTWTPNPNLGTDMHKTFLTANGEAVRIKRGDFFKTPPTVKYSYTTGTDSSSYTYEFDNSEVAHTRLGIVPEDDDIGETSSSEPEGWINMGPGWHRWKGATSSKTAQYVVHATKLPGLMPLFLQNDWDGQSEHLNGKAIPKDSDITGTAKPLSSRDQTRLNAEINIFENSRQEFVIGPAFKPTDTMADVMKRVKIWARTKNGYGFTFLQPLVAAADPKSALDSLTPSTQLERDIVSCLRNVFAIAK